MRKRKSDHYVFYRNSQAGIILLVVYVDDIIITGNDMAGISLKSFLHGQFHTKDLGILLGCWSYEEKTWNLFILKKICVGSIQEN